MEAGNLLYNEVVSLHSSLIRGIRVIRACRARKNVHTST